MRFGLRSMLPGTVEEQVREIALRTALRWEQAAKLNFYLWLLATGRIDPHGKKSC